MKLMEIYQAESVKVYHGSIQPFDKFDMSKIGENGSKGGWGIYLSESEDVARQYTSEGKPIIKSFILPQGKYFDLDNSIDEGTYYELMEGLKYFNSSVYKKSEDFRKEVEEYGVYEYSGLDIYNILAYDFGSPKEMSMFLKHEGFLGNTFKDKTDSSVRNYVLFSPDGLRSAD